MPQPKRVMCYASRTMALRAAKRQKKIVIPFERIVEKKTRSTGRTHIVRQPYFCLTQKPKNWGKVK